MGTLPLGATLVSSVFALSLFRQFAERRKPQQLAWAIAMLAFAVASLAASIGVLLGWSATLFRSYYLFGAIINVPILALGTIYLYFPRRLGHVLAACVLVASAAAAFAVWAHDLPVSLNSLSGSIPAGSDVMSPGVRSLSRYYSYGGFLVVVAGAVWSAARLMRRRQDRLRRLAQGNALIAAGTVVVALGSAFARHGAGSIFAVGLVAGVSVMYAGFLRTRSGPALVGAGTPADSVVPGVSGKATG